MYFNFISKRKAPAHFKVADIQTFWTAFYCKEIWIKKFSQGLAIFFFLYEILIDEFICPEKSAF